MVPPPDDNDDFPAFDSSPDLDKTVEISSSAAAAISDLRRRHQRPYLLVINGPAAGQLFDLPDTPVVVGRSHSADITVVDDGISRNHARIEPQGDEWHIVDLGSTNGIFINGERHDTSILADGDQIKLGSTTILKFSLQDGLEEDFQRRMYNQAVRDSLTEVFNKRYFEDSLTTEFAHHGRHSLALSVVMLDIDFFKKVNDTYGHVAGDYILKTVAGLINGSLRSEDILGRYGGEEFAIILRSTDAKEAFLVADRIRNAIADYSFRHDGRDIKVTVSLGIATLRQASFPNKTELIKAADQNLYAAKDAGRNRTVSGCSDAGTREPDLGDTLPSDD